MNSPDSVLISSSQLQQRIRDLAGEISRDYRDKNPVIMVLLKGSFYFAADLTRLLDFPLALDFMAAGHGSSGALEVVRRPFNSIRDRHVLLIEDIIDSGLSLSFILTWLREHQPASLQVCTLLDNPARRLVQLPVRYLGFTIPDRFVVGYGLDFREDFRHLPDIREYQMEPQSQKNGKS